MCGIFAFVSTEKSFPEEQIPLVQHSLSHRGPDASGVWHDRSWRTALLHTRLSIIDLDAGQQPMANEDGTIHAIVNGEFYDFAQIRQSLQCKGHQFSSESDSEILIHLYEEYGHECVEHLRGEFAFALWDSKRQELFAARDRFGIKPLLFSKIGDSLLLASEVKALFAAGLKAEWDLPSVYHSLSTQYPLPQNTLFKDVAQLPPGHLLCWRKGSFTIRQYWDLHFATDGDSAPMDYEQATAAVRELLDDAIKTRLRADVPLCCHLSGGIDSSIVAARSNALLQAPLHCFCVSFDDSLYDEATLARRLIEESGGIFHQVPMDDQQIIQNLEEATYFSEGFAINGHFIGKRILNKAIRAAGFKVALTGEGADEVFAGYAHLRQDFLADSALYSNENPKPLLNSNAASSGIMIAQEEAQIDLSSVMEKLGFIPHFLKAKAGMGFRMRSMMSQEFAHQFADVDCFGEFISSFEQVEQLSGRSPVHQSMYLWTKSALTNYILRTLGDGMEMSASIEGRLPFLDHRLVEFVSKLPTNFKIRPNSKHGTLVEKAILRDAYKDTLPAYLYKREKHPFIAPPLPIAKSGLLKEFLLDTLASADALSLPFLNCPKIREQVRNCSQMNSQCRKNFDPVLFTTLTAVFLQRRFALGY
ncbi:MAG: asparagine synthase (glutamine-hydrolyzing) [Bdellovibrionales bacterium]|nr:asparagine synthase (glutamine-hydrolyzing) [Bdellovibrionales bacterium]